MISLSRSTAAMLIALTATAAAESTPRTSADMLLPRSEITFLEILFRSRFTARSFDDYSDDVADRRISQNMRA
jgi:hypothetical protein